MAANKHHRYGSMACTLYVIAAVALIAPGFTGCAIKKPVTDPAQDLKARSQLLKAKAFNHTITTSKGTGRLVIESDTKRQNYKIAWAAQAPDRLRLTLMVSGHPIETIAANGQRVTFVSHTGRHRPHTTSTADPDLKNYIGVPVHLSEMIAILLGRIPIRDFDRAWMVPGRPGIIQADKNYSSQLQELMSDTQGRVTRFRILDSDRALIFGMNIDNWTQKNKSSIPASLSVYDAAGRTLYISLSGMRPNAPVKESMFLLTAPGS